MQIVNTLSALLELLSRKHADGILWLSSGLLLAAPVPLLETLRIAQYANEYGHIFGFAFLISSACLIVRVTMRVLKYIIKQVRHYATAHRRKSVLKSLSNDEYKILRKFTSTINGQFTFNRANKAVMSLVDKGILLDLRPEINEFLPRRWYRIAPAYSRYVESYLHIMPLSECPQDSQSR